MSALTMTRRGDRRTGQAPPKRPSRSIRLVPTEPVDLDAAEQHAADLATAQGQHGRCLDFEPVRLDTMARTAHACGEALLYRWQGGFTTIPAPPPGDDLPTWPEVRP